MPGKSPATAAEFIADVRACLGRPYVFGAAGPDAFDCSGLVYYNARKVGITKCPRTSEEQFAWTQPVQTPLAGDLVFFTGAENDPPPGHVGIVVAPGVMIDAPHTGTVVQQANYGTNGTGVNNFMGYGRMPGLGASTANQSLITATRKQTATATTRQGAALGGMAGAVMFAVAFLAVILLLILLVYSGLRFAT
jgi:NlpC/P60 family